MNNLTFPSAKTKTRQYAKVEVSRRLEILEKKVIRIGRKDDNIRNESGNKGS